ncbi:MAG: ComF family protein [Deltaproteobacteria bacterium]|nr:MAG: ComF family protein [Deltaproteobacteria bacterium]
MWSWIFPKRCPVCKIFIKDEDDLCLSCEQNWPRLKSACCTLCLFPFKNNDEPHLCGDCLTYESAFEEVKALGLYTGDLKNLILKFKFQKEESLALFFAKLFSQFQNQYDLIIPVPLHFKKLRQRGYNQSALIAKNLSKQWQIDWDPFC